MAHKKKANDLIETKQDYAMHFAGKLWVFQKVFFSRDEDGHLGLSMSELNRLHRAVANAICADDIALSTEELEFLCKLTTTTNKSIAETVKCNPTNISKWRKRQHVPDLESIVLKEFFWEKIFGEDIEYPNASFGKSRLQKMGQTAIKLKLADPVERDAA